MESKKPLGTKKATRELIPHLLDLVEKAGAALTPELRAELQAALPR